VNLISKTVFCMMTTTNSPPNSVAKKLDSKTLATATSRGLPLTKLTSPFFCSTLKPWRQGLGEKCDGIGGGEFTVFCFPFWEVESVSVISKHWFKRFWTSQLPRSVSGIKHPSGHPRKTANPRNRFFWVVILLRYKVALWKKIISVEKIQFWPTFAVFFFNFLAKFEKIAGSPTNEKSLKVGPGVCTLGWGVESATRISRGSQGLTTFRNQNNVFLLNFSHFGSTFFAKIIFLNRISIFFFKKI